MISKTVLNKFLLVARQRLSGRWLIVGGAVIPLIDSEYRPTVDIDIANVDNASSESSLELMRIAEDVGLPVEAINQAASYFVHQIESFDSEMIPIFESKNVSLFRPNFYLYLQLKASRLTETDLEDCFRYFDFCSRVDEKIKLQSCLEFLDRETRGDENLDRIGRRKKLAKYISTPS